MTEANVLATIRQTIQDLIAPDLRELKANHAALEKIVDVRFTAVEARFTAVADQFSSFEKRIDERFTSLEKLMQADSQKRDAQFAALLAHLREASAEAKNATTQQVYDLAQRIAVVETRQMHDHTRQLS